MYVVLAPAAGAERPPPKPFLPPPFLPPPPMADARKAALPVKGAGDGLGRTSPRKEDVGRKHPGTAAD
eukprot:8019061-Pyramimonas_sp.AAC.1